MNGLFGLNGLFGYLVAVVLLLSIVGVLGYMAVVVQKTEANNPYKIEASTTIPMQNADINQHYKTNQ
ncbi:hypothetical protein CCZ01_08010 [Helicobacter monodelphidis]|uniref:DUF4006 family protein n=1 Tax=Helicobacter sp. 15-1451 TaxID=2004995 RepID=UPI000DCF3A71|nr:DUF4006 family protein [Helicobacter sp. 15-1451]RAX56875.1 hypothetical protein CCZ01_08010 [Helicobacter sp. 15-1451]